MGPERCLRLHELANGEIEGLPDTLLGELFRALEQLVHRGQSPREGRRRGRIRTLPVAAESHVVCMFFSVVEADGEVVLGLYACRRETDQVTEEDFDEAQGRLDDMGL